MSVSNDCRLNPEELQNLVMLMKLLVDCPCSITLAPHCRSIDLPSPLVPSSVPPHLDLSIFELSALLVCHLSSLLKCEVARCVIERDLN